MTTTNRAAELILDKALKTVCGDRSHLHGDTEQSFKIIAEFWSTYLRAINKQRPQDVQFSLNGGDVAEMMSLLKKVRFIFGKLGNEENFVDDAGYVSIAGMLNGIKVEAGPEKPPMMPDDYQRYVIKDTDYKPSPSVVRRAGVKSISDALKGTD